MQIGFGAGILTGTRNDIAGGMPVRFGIMQDISIDFDGEIKELYGQSQFALDARRGKTKITGKAKFAQISGLVMATLFFGTSLQTGMQVPVYNEAGTIGNAITLATSAATNTGNAVLTFISTTNVAVGAPVKDTTAAGAIPVGTYVLSKTSTTVTLSANVVAPGVGSGDVINFGSTGTVVNSANYLADLGVFNATTGDPFIFVVAAPLQGQYTQDNNGIYVFNSADAGTAVLYNYLYTSSMAGVTISPGNPLMGVTPKFRADFNQFVDANTLSLTLFSCVANKLTLPTKIDDYIIQEMDFMAYANAAGQTFTMGMTTND